MQQRVRTDVIVNLLQEQLGVTFQVKFLEDEEPHCLSTQRPMVLLFSTEGDTLDSCQLVSELLKPTGFEQWGHGAGATLVIDGVEGVGGLMLWGMLPWHLHEVSQ